MLTTSDTPHGPAALTPSRVMVAMLGARMHYAVPRLLHEAGLLERLYTDSYIGNKPWLKRALTTIPPRMQTRGIHRWLGRCDTVLPADKVISFETFGLWYAWARHQAHGYAQIETVFRNFAERFAERILKDGLGKAAVVWGFNSAALELFQAAKAQGRYCVLEQTILPQQLERKLLMEESERWPGWQHERGALSGELSSPPREEGEWALADCIVAGSEFVRDGLLQLGVPATKIRVVPYGVDVARFQLLGGARDSDSDASYQANGPRRRPLRVLFAGHVGLRKGVPDLLHALQQFEPKDVEARLVGSINLKQDKLSEFARLAQLPGPVPRTTMSKLFRWADVFVLPSIVEGSATVTYEALMSGVPVIATRNTGSVVRDGIDGFIIPIRNPDALAAALRRYVDEPAVLSAHQAAAARDRERLGLDVYRQNLSEVIQSVVHQ